MADELDALIERLCKREAEARETIKNCEAVMSAFSEEMRRFENRDGHNVYAVRLAVDHKNAIRTETAFANDMAEAIAALRNTRAAREPSEAEVEAMAGPIYDELEGPINNQDYLRQTRQWERAKVVARAAIAALRAKGGAR